jgi:drug/metabolite transporter (DMT)-like permease
MQPDTRKLLRTGLLLFCTGVIAAALIFTSFGGITRRQGPHTNLGWLSLILAMICLPTGSVTLLLAAIKLIGDRRR